MLHHCHPQAGVVLKLEWVLPYICHNHHSESQSRLQDKRSIYIHNPNKQTQYTKNWSMKPYNWKTLTACSAMISICTSGGASVEDSTKCKFTSLYTSCTFMHEKQEVQLFSWTQKNMNSKHKTMVCIHAKYAEEDDSNYVTFKLAGWK